MFFERILAADEVKGTSVSNDIKQRQKVAIAALAAKSHRWKNNKSHCLLVPSPNSLSKKPISVNLFHESPNKSSTNDSSFQDEENAVCSFRKKDDHDEDEDPILPFINLGALKGLEADIYNWAHLEHNK